MCCCLLTVCFFITEETISSVRDEAFCQDNSFDNGPTDKLSVTVVVIVTAVVKVTTDIAIK